MKSNTEWRLWGAKDPLFGVASWQGRQVGGARPWTDAEFYALGADWLDFKERWERYGLRRESILEIGCGAGRMTKRLADDFQRVEASDVAEGMLAYARDRVTAPNIRWHLSDGLRLPAADASVDAVFSCHVLQHFESVEAQLACFREIHRVLRSRGTFLIHLPLHAFPLGSKFTKVASLGYRAHLALARVKGALRRELMRRFGKPYMHGVSHDTHALFGELQQIGFAAVEFASFPMKSNNDLHTCVLGTKP